MRKLLGSRKDPEHEHITQARASFDQKVERRGVDLQTDVSEVGHRFLFLLSFSLVERSLLLLFCCCSLYRGTEASVFFALGDREMAEAQSKMEKERVNGFDSMGLVEKKKKRK